MPFTPLHMGPGLLVRSLCRGGFSLVVFGWTQILMDLEPLWGMLTGRAQLHGWSHTYLGATLLAIVAAFSGKFAGEWGLKLLRLQEFLPITWKGAAASAFVGAWSHVLLDSVMHFDIRPLAPFSGQNALLQLVSIEALHVFCVLTAMLGSALFMLRNRDRFMSRP